MLVEVLLNKPVYILPLVPRARSEYYPNLNYPYRMSWESKLELPTDADSFPDFDNLEDVRTWLDDNLSWLDDGFWVLVGRAIYSHAAPLRKPSLKQVIRLSHKCGRRRRVRRQHRFQGIVVLLKFEMLDHSVITLYQRRRMGKFVPFVFRKYPVIQWLDQKISEKRGGHPNLEYPEDALA